MREWLRDNIGARSRGVLYRPFVSNGEIRREGIFVVGYNPATPIEFQDVNVENYIDMLLNGEQFDRFYRPYRLAKGKNLYLSLIGGFSL